MLCRRCYIQKHNLKKKDAKHLNSTTDKFECDSCGEYKTLVIEKRTWEEDNYDEDE